tara:strand:- start:2234 stop:3274 length:1041 start_codon:yes stop_codon:yes gene_type:complete
MKEVTTAGRKDDHIRINLEENVQFNSISNGLDKLYFVHNSVPETNMSQIDTSIDIFGKELRMPLLISCMTGGTDKSGNINRILAEVAQQMGIGLGLGSMRVVLEDHEKIDSFCLRELAPDILLLANIGAVQLNYGVTVGDCRQLVDLSEADGLVLHFNPLQEAVQDEGQTNFSGLLNKIEHLCKEFSRDSIPVIAKEVGWGFSEQVCKKLSEVGISAIDVAGAGGTSWSQVEMYRSDDESNKKVASVFENWGISTVEAILNAGKGAPDIPCIASGGLRNGLEMAKCLSLGASLAGMAHPFLVAAMESPESLMSTIYEIEQQLRVAMFCTGSSNIENLKKQILIDKQ